MHNIMMLTSTHYTVHRSTTVDKENKIKYYMHYFVYYANKKNGNGKRWKKKYENI